MTLPRRLLFATTISLPVSLGARAQGGFPSRPVTLLVPFSAGGASDRLARMLAAPLSARLGVPVQVENQPGEGGLVAAQSVARARADGHTLLLHTNGIVLLAANAPHPAFNPNRSLVPVAHVAELPGVLVVHPSVPAQSVADLLSHLRQSPRPLRCGVVGSGGPDHVACRALATAAEAAMEYPVYSGAAPLSLDLLAGDVQINFSPLAAFAPLLREGRLRALAVTTAERLPQWPHLPTLTESGIGIEGTTINAIFAPARTPPAVIARLHAEFSAILDEPVMRERMSEMGAFRRPLDNAGIADMFRRDWEETIRARRG